MYRIQVSFRQLFVTFAAMIGYFGHELILRYIFDLVGGMAGDTSWPVLLPVLLGSKMDTPYIIIIYSPVT